jgi:ribosomal protein S27E
MKIKTKFDKGDIVYIIQPVNAPLYYNCPDCLGEGVLLRKDGSSITCPQCNGEKHLSNNSNIEYVVVQGTINGVKISMFNWNDINDLEINYNILITNSANFNGFVVRDEYYVYRTEKEANKRITNDIQGYPIEYENRN